MSALANVQLRDGRFVMLPADRIAATRNATSGLLRQRALWLLGCLHLLCDEQRHEYGGSAATISREALCAMTSLSPKTLTKLTRTLIDEAVLEVQRPIGPSGSLPSVYRLLGATDGPRVHITHTALRVMRTRIPAGRLTGAFATYLTIAEILNEAAQRQRDRQPPADRPARRRRKRPLDRRVRRRAAGRPAHPQAHPPRRTRPAAGHLGAHRTRRRPRGGEGDHEQRRGVRQRASAGVSGCRAPRAERKQPPGGWGTALLQQRNDPGAISTPPRRSLGTAPTQPGNGGWRRMHHPPGTDCTAYHARE